MRKDQIKLSNVRNIPQVIFTGTFDNHMLNGDRRGQSHSGLHLIASLVPALAAAGVRAGGTAQGRINDHAATIMISEVDLRSETFKASVNIYGTAKVSTFFPVGTTLEQAKNYIRAAWTDYCTYGCSTYGGGAVDVYVQMRNAFGLNWAGMARIGTKDIWIGCQLSGPVDTAFPAVNSKFG